VEHEEAPAARTAGCEFLRWKIWKSAGFWPGALMTKMMDLDQLVAKYPTINGKGVAIADIDSGLNFNHPIFFRPHLDQSRRDRRQRHRR